MELFEQETIICINRAEVRDGWWSFGTSVRAVAESFRRKFRKYILDCRESRNMERVTFWAFRVDAKCLRDAPFMSPRSQESRSPAQVEASRIAMARLRDGRGKK